MRKSHTERFGRVPGSNVALLSAPSKMPGFSWSIPAHKACPRANGTICASCYASKGMYRYNNVRRAQETRFQWTVTSLRTPAGRLQWLETMAAAIRRTNSEYFRVHDSGDMFNLDYVRAWHEVCRELGNVRFWIPTRAYQIPRPAAGPFTVLKSDPLLDQLRELAKLPNVTVRPSALDFGAHAPSIPGLHAGSTADNPDVFRAFQCPAHLQGNACGDCRQCWDDKETPVSYRLH